jgi:excisionase family DNA binding protein
MEPLSFDHLPKEIARLHSRMDFVEDTLKRIAGINKPIIEEEILTVPQVAQLLSLSIPTIYGLIHRKELPIMKRGKRVYFKRSQIIDYLEKGSVDPESVPQKSSSINNYKKGAK